MLRGGTFILQKLKTKIIISNCRIKFNTSSLYTYTQGKNYSKQGEKENSTSTNPSSKSILKMNQISLPFYFKNKLKKLNFFISEDIYFKTIFSILHNRGANIILNYTGFVSIMKIILLTLSNNEKKSFIIVENDLQAQKILEFKICETNLVYIRDPSDLHLLEHGLPKIYVINYLNLLSTNLKHLKLNDQYYMIFFDIKDATSLSLWINNFYINVFNTEHTKILFFFNDKNQYNESIKNISQIAALNKTFSLKDEEIQSVLLNSLSHYAMCIRPDDISTVASECVKKYSGMNRKILIIFGKKSEKEKFSDREQVNQVNPNLYLFTNNELELYDNKQNNPFLNFFDILIEYPFVDTNSLMERRKYIKTGDWNESTMISLFKSQQHKEINHIRQKEIIKIKIENLLSTSFLLNYSEENLSSDLELENNFHSKIISTIKLGQLDEKFEKFQNLYQIVKKNETLMKYICYNFFQQNYDILLNKDRENISLITGNPGEFTCLFSCETPKQKEDRYYLTKFFIEQGLGEMSTFDTKFFRVFESFDYICDIQVEKFDEICKKGAEKQIRIEVVKTLPIVFFHQYSDFLRNKK